MTALYILLGLVLLLLLPVGLRLRYDDACRVTVRWAGIPVWRYTPQKAAKQQARAEKKARTPAQKDAKPAKRSASSFWQSFAARLRREGCGAVVAEVQELAKLVTGSAARLWRTLHFGRCTVEMAVAKGDAADTAQHYGRLCAVVYPALELVRSHLRVRHLRWDMRPDFLRERDAVRVDVRVHVIPLQVLAAAVQVSLRAGFWMIRKEKAKGQVENNG